MAVSLGGELLPGGVEDGVFQAGATPATRKSAAVPRPQRRDDLNRQVGGFQQPPGPADTGGGESQAWIGEDLSRDRQVEGLHRGQG
jgi:hypothetical protein